MGAGHAVTCDARKALRHPASTIRDSPGAADKTHGRQPGLMFEPAHISRWRGRVSEVERALGAPPLGASPTGRAVAARGPARSTFCDTSARSATAWTVDRGGRSLWRGDEHRVTWWLGNDSKALRRRIGCRCMATDTHDRARRWAANLLGAVDVGAGATYHLRAKDGRRIRVGGRRLKDVSRTTSLSGRHWRARRLTTSWSCCSRPTGRSAMPTACPSKRLPTTTSSLGGRAVDS